MRIFISVIGGLFLVAVVVAVGWFGWQYLTLQRAVSQVEISLKTLQRAVNGGIQSRCLKQGSVSGYQLRFSSSSEYVIETVCSGSENITLEKKQLPAGTERVYGSGVFVGINDGVPQWGTAWFQLQFKDRSVAIGVVEGVVKINWNPNTFEIGGDCPAIAQCSEWGFSCCQQPIEQGVGIQVQTMDCPANCFQQCNQAPIALFFNTDPLMDNKTRTVTVRQSEQVTFGFEVVDTDGIERAMIDFGDGKKSSYLSAKESDFSHVYQCSQARCSFTARLLAWDTRGIELPSLDAYQVTVIVNR